MKAARATKATLPRRALSQLVNAGGTGALHVGGDPGGVLYLTEGRVSYAESPAAPGAGELLTTSGRIAPRTWESVVSSGKDGHRVGRLLLEQGHLTEGELELCVLGVIYDAAYFVLQPAAVPVRFAEGEQHWLGPVCRVDADVLSRETTRRRRLLDEIFESSTVDTAPVSPAPRPPVERVVLSALQYELLIAADGERTPATLARILGRAGYVTLQQVRELAAAGLITTAPEDRPGPARQPVPQSEPVPQPEPVPVPQPVPQPVPVPQPESEPQTVSLDPVTQQLGPVRHLAEPTVRLDKPVEPVEPVEPVKLVKPPARTDEQVNPGRKATGGRRRAGARAGAAIPVEGLPRRSPGEQMPSGAGDVATAPDGGPLRGDAPDEALLTRIRSALKALR